MHTCSYFAGSISECGDSSLDKVEKQIAGLRLDRDASCIREEEAYNSGISKFLELLLVNPIKHPR